MMYAYPYTLARRAVVATFDLSAKNLALFHTHHWLSKPSNVLVLRLTSPAWVADGIPGTPTEPPAAEDAMRTWTVAEVAAWLESEDAVGLAEVCRRNAVRGVDVLSFATAEEVRADLQVTPFAARRLIACRDQALVATAD